MKLGGAWVAVALCAVAAALMPSAAWGKADLVISSVTLSSRTVYPGDRLEINSYTKNIGANDTGWWTWCDAYYYFGTSANPRAVKIGTGMTPNANEPNGISVGEAEEDTLSWTVPAGTTPGTYLITCVADAEGEVSESNESNNSRSVSFTVKGIPAITRVYWQNPRDVSAGDTAVLCGECENIPAGATVTLRIYEDDLDVLADELTATVTAKVSAGTGGASDYFAAMWPAVWQDDASGDPEYYFKASYGTAEAASGEDTGALLKVSNDRMTPSPVAGDFYYDPAGVAAGPSTARAELTDDRIPLILVHGMSGDAKPDTLNYWYGWVNSDTNAALGYFNTGAMRNMFRVYRYVYDSRDFISTNAVKFADFVNQFYADHPAFADRQVVIMAHSMGGLVSRYAMNVNPTFASRVHRLVTLGSPHLGSQGANPTWIKYSGPDDNSWFISGIYNTFGLHNGTAGCFDLAWYATNQIPAAALTTSAISGMAGTYNEGLLTASLRNPFCGWPGMMSTAADSKLVLFGGSSTNAISDYLSKDWPDAPSGEVKTDHLGLWVATKIFRSMSYANGTGVGDNDGLVPVNSALMTDANRHPNAVKRNLNALEGQQVDHASYLDVPVTMDSVRTRLLTMVRVQAQPVAAQSAARWRLADGDGVWQKPGVRLPALTPGKLYTVEFKDVPGYVKPAPISFTAVEAVTRVATGTYTLQEATVTNRAPESIALTAATVPENASAQTVVGTLSCADPDAGDTAFTFTLVSGDGDTGNACFTIDGNRLLTAQVFDFEEFSAHFCRIRATDAGGLFTEQAFTISVADVDETTPGQETGAGWATLAWEPVADATAYRLDVSACGGNETIAVPDAPLGTNTFLAGQRWRYNTPGVASAPNGSVQMAPKYHVYGTTNAHFLIGTNGVALQSEPLALNDASRVTVHFTHGAWNGGGVNTALSRVEVSTRIDGGDWTVLGAQEATSTTDGGEVVFQQALDAPTGSLIEIRVAAPNAVTLTNASGKAYLRGAYIRGAVVTLEGVGSFEDGCRVTGYPVELPGTVTTHCVAGLPADAAYFYRVEAFVDGVWTPVTGGNALTTDVVVPPMGLHAATTNYAAFTAAWQATGEAETYDLQVTPDTTLGAPEIVTAAPSVNLSSAANTSGWSYSAEHRPVASNWWCEVAGYPNSCYYGLVMACNPGLMSPVLDLSGFQSAQLSFAMRVRDAGVPLKLWYSIDGGATWTDSGTSATISSVYLSPFTLDVPSAALVANARLELRADGATSVTHIWAGSGVGVRDVVLTAIPHPQPDYSAAPLQQNLTGLQTALTALEPETLYHFRVRAVDTFGNVSDWAEASVATLSMHAPYNLSISATALMGGDDNLPPDTAEVPENAPAGTTVGMLSAADDDTDDILTFDLVAGEGSEDNDLFAIADDRLVTASILNYEIKTNHSVRVRATDGAGLFVEGTFALNVLDVEEAPEILSISALTNGLSLSAAEVSIAEVLPNTANLDWEPETPAPAYDIYASTNLLNGFFFVRRVYTNCWMDPDFSAPAKFWCVKPVTD